MKSLTEIVRLYEIAYRDLVTFKTRSTNPNLKDALILKERRDWSFICTALDVIGDTTLAIKNFMEYGLEGSMGGNDEGEKYLRLYGVLNSTYLQQEAIRTLYSKINLQKSDYVKQIAYLKIRETRNKIGAHSSDYGKSKKKDSYALIRNTLSGFKFEYLNNENDERESVDMMECLEKHLQLIINLLDEAYETSIKKLYRDNQPKQKQELHKLFELRQLNPRA